MDRYSAIFLFFLVLAVGLNILDALLTMMILDLNGWKIDPIVRCVIDL